MGKDLITNGLSIKYLRLRV